MPTYDKSYNNFGRPLVPDDSCKDSAPRHPRLWRRFLKVFTIYVHGGHLGSTDHDHFSNLSFPHPKEAPHEIWAKLAQRLQRRSHLKMLMDGGKVITIAHPEQRSGELKKKKVPPPWRPWFLTYHDGLNNLGRKLQKKHSCRVILKSVQWFLTRRFLNFSI